MNHKAFVRKLNLGIIVKGFRIVSGDTEPELVEARRQLITSHTVVRDTGNGVIVGVRPLIHVQETMLTASWPAVALRSAGEIGYLAVSEEQMGIDEEQAVAEVRSAVTRMIESDEDILEGLRAMGFRELES